MEDHAAEKAMWLSHYTQKIAHYDHMSKDYAHLAVQSLIAMNAGALLAIPPIVQVFFSDKIEFQDVLYSIVAFLGGLVAAIICAYAAYFNYQNHMVSATAEMYKNLTDMDEKADTRTFHRLKKWRADTRADMAKREEKSDKRIVVFFYVANGLGVSSLMAFVVGAVSFAMIALKPA